MSSPTLALRRHRRAAWTLLAVTALALLGASAPPAAQAGRIAAERAEARRVETRLNNLNARVDVAVQAYDEAAQKRHDVHKAIRANTARLRLARHNLRVSQAKLAQVLVDSYKTTPQEAAVFVLGSGSFSQLIDRIDFIRRADALQAQVVRQVKAAKAQVELRQAKLKVEQRAVVKLVKRARAKREQANALVIHQRTVLAGIKGNIARLITQAQQRQNRLARRRARAAALAAQQAQEQQSGGGSGSTTGGGSGAPLPPAGTLGEQAVAIAMGELGVPYRWGGASPQTGFDCSGLTMWVYAQLGIHLEHFTGSQWNAGPHVPRDQLEPGDLVFFEQDIGHVGIYIGNGLFIEAPHTGAVVRISSLSEAWYAEEYVGAVRIVG